MKTFTYTAVNATPQDAGLSYSSPREKVRYQVDVTGFTGVSVKLHGRLAPTLPWAVIATATAAGIGEVPAYPFIAASLDAATASATPASDEVTVSIA